MKKYIFIAFMLFCASAKAQTSFSCEGVKIYTINSAIHKTMDSAIINDAKSLIIVNKDESVISLRNFKLGETFCYVKTREYDEKANRWIYNVLDETGTQCEWIFDPKNKLIMLFTELNSTTDKLMYFHIRAIF